jgi:2-hydroxychromene-2-carboxylate isomerase
MTAPIDFYFDFSSPYGYLASQKIDALAAKYGRAVDWRPVLLGAVFKERNGAADDNSAQATTETRLRERAISGIANFNMPSKFPIAARRRRGSSS